MRGSKAKRLRTPERPRPGRKHGGPDPSTAKPCVPIECNSVEFECPPLEEFQLGAIKPQPEEDQEESTTP